MKYCTKCGSILESKRGTEPTDFDGYTGKPRFEVYLTCPNYTTPTFWHMGVGYSDGSVRYNDDKGHIKLVRIEER